MRFAKDNALMLESANTSASTSLEGNEEYHSDTMEGIKWYDGIKVWWVKGKAHRLDGPAVKYPDGSGDWYADGKLHRLDGPTIEQANGYKEWWVNGKKYSEEEFNRLFGKYKNTEDRQVVADMEDMFD